MSDDHLQHSDSIDDAIRQAERKLEQRIEELRSMASSDAPVASGARSAGTNASEPWWDEAAHATAGDTTTPAPSQPARPVSTGGVSNLTSAPVSSGSPDDTRESAWSDAELRPVSSVPTTSRGGGSGLTPEETEFWAQTRTALRLLQQSTDQLRHDLPAEVTRRVQDTVSSELTTRLGQQLGGAVVDNMERIVRDELVSTGAALRQIQQQLPDVATQMERAVMTELEAPNAALRQLQDELPTRLDRVERNLERVLVEDIGRALHDDVLQVGHALQENGARVERTVADGYDRVERAVRSQFEQVEHTLHGDLEQVQTTLREELDAPLGTLRQLHEELPVQFTRIERAVRETDGSRQLSAIAGTLGEQDRVLGSAHELLRHQDDVLRNLQESTVGAVRRALDTSRADISDLRGAVGDLSEAQRSSLAQLSSFSTDLERDRLQRVEDLELTVDTMSIGWQGVLTAMTRLIERTADVDQRIDGIEAQMEKLAKLDQTVDARLSEVRCQLDSHLGEMSSHLQALQPAPIIVTVAHPDATITHASRPGFRHEDEGDDSATGGPAPTS